MKKNDVEVMIIDNKSTNKIKALRLLDKATQFSSRIFSRTTVISILLILQLLFIIASLFG